MGVGQNRSFEEAIQYELTRLNTKLEISPEMGELLMKQYSTYDQIKGYTPIIHGNDYDLSSKERQSLNPMFRNKFTNKIPSNVFPDNSV